MTRFVSASILAAAIFAILPAVAGAADYPPCKSRSEDRCMQMPGGMMKDMKPSKDMGVKDRMGGADAMMNGEKPMTGREGATMTPGIPHGCSPATTPCQ